MKPLHTSYHNLGSWRLIRETGASGKFRIVYHATPIFLSAALVFILCGVAALLLHFKLPPTTEMKSVAAGFVVMIGLVVPGSMVAFAMARAKRPPLLTYDASQDLLHATQPLLEIAGASRRVSFSKERFYLNGDYVFEFNLVVDGERRQFLGSSVDSFAQLARYVGEMGFHVAEHQIKI